MKKLPKNFSHQTAHHNAGRHYKENAPINYKSKPQHYLYAEIQMEDWLLEAFAEEKAENDEIRDFMRELLFKRIKQLAQRHLTDRQKELWDLHLTNKYTQLEIAKLMGICQPSVHKLLYGNLDYRYGTTHGGVMTKLLKSCAKDYIASYLILRLGLPIISLWEPVYDSDKNFVGIKKKILDSTINK